MGVRACACVAGRLPHIRTPAAASHHLQILTNVSLLSHQSLSGFWGTLTFGIWRLPRPPSERSTQSADETLTRPECLGRKGQLSWAVRFFVPPVTPLWSRRYANDILAIDPRR